MVLYYKEIEITLIEQKMSRIDVANIESTNEKLKMNVRLTMVPPELNGSYKVSSSQYLLCGIYQFQTKFLCVEEPEIFGKKRLIYFILVKLTKAPNTNTKLHLKYSSKTLNVEDMLFPTQSMWHCVYESEIPLKEFDISFKMTLQHDFDPSKTLMNDEELTDFELRGKDGSVKVHKSVLAASSPVLKAMVLSDFKEAKDGFVDLKEISKSTLESFKSYIYIQKLPATVSEELLLLAMRFMMDEMECACVYTLIENMNTEKANELLDFAVINKCVKLKIAIMENIKNGSINIEEIKEKLVNEDVCKEFIATYNCIRPQPPVTDPVTVQQPFNFLYNVRR